MTIEHASIPDAFLHEPKGIVGASSGQAYIADGLGSGSWSAVPVSFNKIIEVLSVDDLPTPIGGVITLEAEVAYFISGSVDISPNVIHFTNVGSALIGFNRSTDQLVTSSPNGLIYSGGQNVVITALTLSNSTGPLFDIDGSTSSVCLLDKVFIGNCASVGTIANYANVVFDNCGVRGVISTQGMLFGGTIGELIVRDSRFSAFPLTMFDLGSSVVNFLNLSGVRFIGANTSSKALDGLAASANIGELGTATGSYFTGMDDPIGTNIQVSDSGWFFDSNVGVPESAFLGDYAMTGNSTTTTVTQNVWTKVAGVTVASPANERFTMSDNNELTSGVLLPRAVNIDVVVSAIKSGGGTDVVEFAVFKDSGGGFVQFDVNSVGSIAATTNIASTSLVLADTAEPGDKYSVYARNTSSGSNLEIRDLQVRIRG